MAEQKQTDITESQQTRAYAGYYGLWTGLCWISSFALFIIGLQEPIAGNFALLVGICSIPLMVYLLRGFRDTIAPLPLGRAWHMAWLGFLAAALLTTAAQYIYMAYIDGGLLMRSISEMMEQPEMVEMMRQLMPGDDSEQMLNESFNTLLATTPSQFTLSYLFWNVILATFFAFPTALFSYSRPKGNETVKRE